MSVHSQDPSAILELRVGCPKNVPSIFHLSLHLSESGNGGWSNLYYGPWSAAVRSMQQKRGFRQKHTHSPSRPAAAVGLLAEGIIPLKGTT